MKNPHNPAFRLEYTIKELRTRNAGLQEQRNSYIQRALANVNSNPETALDYLRNIREIDARMQEAVLCLTTIQGHIPVQED